jgi:glycogen debranching enzyme
MNSEGFNISLEVDGDTGFIIGGNVSNCLTWMDKMGSSAHAGTKGVPATPRAGAPVELVGLLYSCLRIFENFYNNGYYSLNVVQFQGQKVELGRWADKIATNFDHYFYLKEKHPEESRYVKGIYKDVVFSPLHYE